MATVASDGFFNFSQSFFSPDVLQKISREIDQPVEQTKSGLKSVIPTLLMGIVKKGSTQEGAEGILNMARNQVDSSGAVKNTPSASGSEFLHGIFGGNLNSIISKLGTTTGMNSYSVTKMMGVAAPLILGALGSKIKSENMNASSLMSYLSSQKSSLAALLPASLSGIMSGGTAAYNHAHNTSYATSTPTSAGFNWRKLALIVLAVLFLMWLFSKLFTGNRMQTVPVEETTTNRVADINDVIAPSTLNVAAVGSIEEFLRSTPANGEWKRFRFDNLRFSTGTTALIGSGLTEVDQIAAAMKAYPDTIAKVEGYTDNVGPDSVNQELSMNRAMSVKNELVSRGIEARRIEVAGFGSGSPISSNTTEEGRAQNRRIEFLIRH